MLPDTTGIEARKSGFPPLPEGDYTGKITNVSEGVSAQKQTPFVNFEITIDNGDYMGRKVWKRAYLKGENEEKTKTMLGMFAGILEGLGMTQEERHAMRDIGALRAFCDNMSVKMHLTIREYNGKYSNDVSELEQDVAPF
jgi:hypothetical protein